MNLLNASAEDAFIFYHIGGPDAYGRLDLHAPKQITHEIAEGFLSKYSEMQKY